MKKTYRVWLLFFLVNSALMQINTVYAQNFTTKIYTLQHQLAEPLLPAINSALQSGESVNAFNNELIVNAAPSSQQQVANLLRELDKPTRNLLITVRNNNTSNNANSNTGVQGGIRTGEVYLGSGGPVYRERNSISGNNDGLVIKSNGLRINSQHEVRQSTTAQEQKLRAIEGYPAFISAGQSIPYRGVDRWGNAVTEYQDADRGFYVTARIIGNRVQLTISTSNDQLSEDPKKRRHGVIETEHLQTQASGAVGEWINLGGITLQDSKGGQSYTNRSSGSASSIGDISVRVIPTE